MAIYLSDLFDGAAGALNAHTPDIGTNPWTAETQANVFQLDGAGAVSVSTTLQRFFVLAGDVAADQHREVVVEGVFGAIAGSGSQIGVGARHSGTGAENDATRNGYLLWVNDQGYMELRKLTAGALTANAGGFPGGGVTQIAITDPTTANVKLKLVTRNNGANVELEAWYNVDNAGWAQVTDASHPDGVYTDITPGAAFTDPGRDALILMAGAGTSPYLLSVYGNTLVGTAYSISGSTTVTTVVASGMQYSQPGDVSVSGTLVSAAGAAISNMSGISWEWFDSWGAAPTDSGLMSTDVNGAFTVNLPNSVRTPGQTGYLALEKADQLLIGLYKLPVA